MGAADVGLEPLQQEPFKVSVPVPDQAPGPGRARCVVGALGEGAILPTLPLTQSSVGNSRLLSHHWLPVSGVHQLRSEAEFLEALIAYHNDNGRGCG